MRSVLRVLDRLMAAIENAVAIATGIIIVSVLVYSALVRYVLKGSFPEAQELAWISYTWMVFVGSSIAIRHGDHPLVSLIRGRRGALYNSLLYLSCVAFIAAVLYAVAVTPRILLEQVTSVMGLKMWYFYLGLIVGMTFMAVRYVVRVLRLLAG